MACSEILLNRHHSLTFDLVVHASDYVILYLSCFYLANFVHIFATTDCFNGFNLICHHYWCSCALCDFVVPLFLCTEAVSQTKKDEAMSSAGIDVEVEAADSEEVEIVYVRKPTTEQAELARQLMLPFTFFCYKNEPGYVSDDDEDGMLHFCVLLHHLP